MLLLRKWEVSIEFSWQQTSHTMEGAPCVSAVYALGTVHPRSWNTETVSRMTHNSPNLWKFRPAKFKCYTVSIKMWHSCHVLPCSVCKWVDIYTDACWRHVKQLHSSAQFVVHFAAGVPAAVKMPTVKHLCQWLGVVLCVVDSVEMLVPSRSSPRPGIFHFSYHNQHC